MPTYYDPGADAGEVSDALRGLAHASRSFEHPQELYSVIGDLLSGMRSLKQVFDLLAAAHLGNRDRAFDDYGDHAAGWRDAQTAADKLRGVASLIDQAGSQLDEASGAAGRIAWRLDRTTGELSPTRWINVVFLQGQEADEILDVIDADGVLAGLDHLKHWDYGDETTNAALENGYVYDAPPSGPLEAEIQDGEYQATASGTLLYTGLTPRRRRSY